jgi:hypothetical protein
MPRVNYAPTESRKRSHKARLISLVVGLMVLAAAIAPIASAGYGHP